MKKIIRLPFQIIVTLIFLPMLFLWFLFEKATNSTEGLYFDLLSDIWETNNE